MRARFLVEGFEGVAGLECLGAGGGRPCVDDVEPPPEVGKLFRMPLTEHEPQHTNPSPGCYIDDGVFLTEQIGPRRQTSVQKAVMPARRGGGAGRGGGGALRR